MKWLSPCGTVELRLGDYREVLADVEVDAVITDPPYSARTHKGHDAGVAIADAAGYIRPVAGRKDTARARAELSYAAWSLDDVATHADWVKSHCRGWSVALSDNILCPLYRGQFERVGFTGFHPLPCVIPGMTVRMAGDGPSSWAVYANVARPKALHKWGTTPGAYVVKPGDRQYIGGKPLPLMRALIRDYSRPGSLICDPCAGAGTTLLAAAIEGRRAIGAEIDRAAYDQAVERLSRGWTVDAISVAAQVSRNRPAQEQSAFDFGAGDPGGGV